MIPRDQQPGQFAYLHTDIPPGVTLDQWRRRPGRPRARPWHWWRRWRMRWLR
jgi:hypothetical protein